MVVNKDIDIAVEIVESSNSFWPQDSETCKQARVSVVHEGSDLEFYFYSSNPESRLGVLHLDGSSAITYFGVGYAQKDAGQVFGGLVRIINDAEGDAGRNLFVISMNNQLRLLKEDIERKRVNKHALADHSTIQELIIVLEDCLPLLKRFTKDMYGDEFSLKDFASYVQLFLKSNPLNGKYLNVVDLDVLRGFKQGDKDLFPRIKEYRSGDVASLRFLNDLEGYASLFS